MLLPGKMSKQLSSLLQTDETRDEEVSRNFQQRMKPTVDKGWPDDMKGIEAMQHNTERDAQDEIHRLLAKRTTTWIATNKSTRISD